MCHACASPESNTKRACYQVMISALDSKRPDLDGGGENPLNKLVDSETAYIRVQAMPNGAANVAKDHGQEEDGHAEYQGAQHLAPPELLLLLTLPHACHREF